MSDIYVKMKNVSKYFSVLKSEKTALKALKSMIQRKSLVTKHWVLRDVSLEIKRGDKLAIIGKNGAGKTTLLRILAGIYDKTSGYLDVVKEPRILFKFWIGLNGSLSVLDNIYLFGAVQGMSREFLSSRIDAILEMSELSGLRFCPLKELSMGQQQRLALGIFFHNPSDFLIFDESMAFVDQGFAKVCEAYFRELSRSKKTVVITSHAASFLRGFCEKAVWLDEGSVRMTGGIDEVLGEYDIG